MIHIVELHAQGCYSIPPLVLLPVARDSEAGVCASLLSYLTRPKHVRLARDPEILRASLAYQRCSGLGILLLFEPCELLRCPVGMLDRGHWCADMAVQRGPEFHLYIFEMLRYRSLQQVLFGFDHKFPPQTITLPPPNLSTSVTQQPAKRSPRLLQTRVLPSANFKLNRDSSLKRTLGPDLHPKAQMMPRPIPSGGLMPVCQFGSFVGSTGFQTATLQSVSHRLRANPPP